MTRSQYTFCFVLFVESGVTKIVWAVKNRSINSTITRQCTPLHTPGSPSLSVVVLTWSLLLSFSHTHTHTHTLRSRPLLSLSNWSWDALQLSVLPRPDALFLRKTLDLWIAIFIIKPSSRMLCSNMIHPWAVLGLHHRCMPICLGKPEGEDFGMERRTWSKKQKGSKSSVRAVLFGKSWRKKIIQSRKTNVSIAHGGQAGSSGQFCGNTQFISCFASFFLLLLLSYMYQGKGTVTDVLNTSC